MTRETNRLRAEQDNKPHSESPFARIGIGEILDEEYIYGSNGYRVKNWREYKAQEIIIYNPTLVNTRMEPTITRNSFEEDDEVVF